MPRRRIVFVIVAILAAVSIAFFVVDREPRSNGKSLSEWLEAYSEATFKKDLPAAQIAETAIRQLGTNGMSIALARVTEKRSSPRILQCIPFFQKWELERSNRSYVQRRAASYFFYIMGKQCRSAIPELVKAAKDPNRRDVQSHAIYSLIYIGDDAIPHLCDFLSKPNSSLCEATLWCLAQSIAPLKPFKNPVTLRNKLMTLARDKSRRVGGPPITLEYAEPPSEPKKNGE